MSNIRIDNIAPSAGGTYRNAPRGIAAAWAANAVDAATSQDTLNVSSITDTGSGDNRINLSNSMNYANYAVVSMCSAIDNNTNPRNISLYDNPASSYRVWCSVPSGSGSSVGSHTAAFGDLA